MGLVHIPYLLPTLNADFQGQRKAALPLASHGEFRPRSHYSPRPRPLSTLPWAPPTHCAHSPGPAHSLSTRPGPAPAAHAVALPSPPPRPLPAQPRAWCEEARCKISRHLLHFVRRTGRCFGEIRSLRGYGGRLGTVGR